MLRLVFDFTCTQHKSRNGNSNHTHRAAMASSEASSSSDALAQHLVPPPSVLEPCATHVASATAALHRLESELDRSGTDDDALDAVTAAADELRAAFAFVDQLEESVAAAGLLVEATERRLELLERGERLPDSLAQLPPAMFTNHQFTRQVRRREKVVPPDLPELQLLPPSRAEAAATAANAADPNASLPASMSADELQKLAAIKADELKELAASSIASAKEQAPQLLAAAERARDRARNLLNNGSDMMSGFWSGR